MDTKRLRFVTKKIYTIIKFKKNDLLVHLESIHWKCFKEKRLF